MKSSRFGYKILATKKVDKVCPNCGKADLELSIVGRYVSFLYIPLMGTRKRASVHCNSCEKVFTDSYIPHQVQNDADALKKKTRIPLWFNTGLFLIILGGLIKVLFKYVIN